MAGTHRGNSLGGVAPALTVVVPVLDEADHIAVLLSSLQGWRQAGVEVVVVDGGSRDRTANLALPLADKVLIAPRGRARQMNVGAAAAGGTQLLFLHVDTTPPTEAPQLIGQALRHHAWGRFDVRIAGRSRWLPMVAMMMNLRSRLSGIATGDQALFMTRSAFDAMQGFPDQPLMEDIEASRRLKRMSPPACLRQKVVTSGRRWDQRGAWRTIVLMWRLRWDYWRGVPAAQLAARYR